MPLFPTATATAPVSPSDFGLISWNYDPELAANQSSPTNNTVTLMRVNLRQAQPVTNVCVFIGTGGTGLTTSENFAGLYTSAGSLVASTADQTAAWAGTGLMSMALASGPYTVAAGFYWVAVLSNESAGAPPMLLRMSAPISSAALNLGQGAALARAGTAGTGTTLPPSFTPSSITSTSICWWAGIS